ncbi:MAG TPA: ABC transporter ATP-binding protein [Gaiellaceae bacterium]|nr:ABC transporter ATP-binding protein [Gaiellaceae bacterium]
MRDLIVDYRRQGVVVRAVAGVTLSVEQGEITGLVGESGCGKSSLARAIVGLVRPTAGEIVFDGRRVAPLGRGARSPHETRLQMVFQNPYASLNPRRTIGSQLVDGIRLSAARRRQDYSGRVAELLEMVGIPATAARRFPHEFSGGQRQRIAIARALAAEPKLIVLDEPLSSLDASAQAQISNLLVKLAREFTVGLLLISHDLAIVQSIADRLAVMYLGTIVECGNTGEVWADPRHPYTEALVGAIPSVKKVGRLPSPLAGEVPDPADPPQGCRFHPRCPKVFDRCREDAPELYEAGEERYAACFLWDRRPDQTVSRRETKEVA